MKVGSLVYATDQGLGILAKSFFDHGVVTDVMVVRHGRHPTHDWYPGAPVLGSLEFSAQVRDFVTEMDAMLFFETPFIWQLMDHCRNVAGCPTALMVMHECLHRNVWQHTPDLFLCPSLLDANLFAYKHKHVYLPVPVEVPWRQRQRAEVFVHNSGWGGLKGRNGTRELLQAMTMVKTPAKLVLRSQQPLDLIGGGWDRPREKGQIDFRIGTQLYASLWDEGYVFVFPEKFNGLSLPLQEARAAGMLVMCGDRFPMNQWLPKEPLIPVAGYNRDQRIGPPYQPFDEAIIRPEDISAKIDEWYGRDISEYSLQGKAWAETMSWERIKPEYVRVLEELVG